jgi:hypothetical protein
MKIVFLGDVVGQPGRRALKKIIPELKQKYSPDLIFVNGENMAAGQGLSEKGIGEVLETGVDYITSGDHAYNLNGSADLLENGKLPLLRPLNWPGETGRGFALVSCGARQVLLINLIGRVFMRQDFEDPFKKISEFLEDYSLKGKEKGVKAVDAIIMDFHAEATSEKMALAWHLDGKISALFGSHTHVQTADERILPGGTAFLSDLGMTGPMDSVLGMDKDIVIKRFLTQRLFKMEVAQGPVRVNGVCLEIDDTTGLAKSIERIQKVVAPE